MEMQIDVGELTRQELALRLCGSCGCSEVVPHLFEQFN